MNIRGTEGLSPADLQSEIARGARFVSYQWCLSLLVVTFKRGSRLHYLPPGATGFLPSFCWSAFSLVAGWWGFPWGPIYTLGALWTNLRGGIDVTAAVSAELAADHGAPAVPPLAGTGAGAPRWSAGPLAALGVFAAAIFAVVGGSLHYAQQHRAVALVNGLDTPYAVSIDGVSHPLPAHSTRRLELPEGMHRAIAALPGGVGETAFAFTTDAEPVVVNPDSAALVAEESCVYASESKPAGENPAPTLHSGRQVYRFGSPDYFLAEFPDSVSMPKHADRITRTRLAVYPDIAIGQTAAIVLARSGRPALVEYLSALGARLPRNQTVLATAAQMLEPAEARNFFAQHLATRPVLVEWHRVYQSYGRVRLPEVDLHAEYRRLAEAEPEEGAFAYLYGRLLDNPAEDTVWFERAIAAGRPCAYGHLALAYAAASRGDFPGALACLDRARQAGVDSPSERSQRIDCLLALGRPADALREFRSRSGHATIDFAHAGTEFHLSYLAAGKAAAQRVVDDFIARLPEGLRAQSSPTIRKNFGARLAYYEGNPAAVGANIDDEDDDSDKFVAALCRADRAAAERHLAALPRQTSTSWLLLYLSARLARDPRAEAYWNNAVTALAGEPEGHARLAAHFAGTAPLAPADIVDLPMDFAEKRLVLAAIGLHEPALRAAAFARARQCNFSREFPHHLVAAALASAQP